MSSTNSTFFSGFLDDATERLRSLMEASRLTIEEMAAELDEKPQRLKDIFRGKTRLPSEILLRVPEKFPVRVEWWLRGEGEIFHQGYAAPLGNLGEDHVHQRISREQRRAYVAEGDDFVTIPYYDAKASAGLGAINGDEIATKPFKFRRDWWVKHIGVPATSCFSMEIGGDSMAPRLTEAHLPIIQWTEEMGYDGIYVFRLDGEVFIKTLERIPGRGMLARSENPKYTPWEIGDGSTFGEFKIIGRILKKQLIVDP